MISGRAREKGQSRMVRRAGGLQSSWQSGPAKARLCPSIQMFVWFAASWCSQRSLDPAQSGILSSKKLVSSYRRAAAAAPKRNDFTVKEGKTGRHLEKCPSRDLVQWQGSRELSCKNADGRERWEKWVFETGRFTVLKCSLKRFTLLKWSQQCQVFFLFPPFSQITCYSH